MSDSSPQSLAPLSHAGRKRKRRRNIFAFHSFCDSDCPVISSEETFRDRIRAFLRERAEIEDYHVRSMPVWSTLLVLGSNEGFIVPLYVLEETVRNSDQPYCVHCRCCGWSHHLVSRRRYHIVIPADEEWKNQLTENSLDCQNNLLHGVIHCNGFGHLLRINGVQGGSKILRGRELMDLWDRLCTFLGTRKITLEDESEKDCISLRLLHGVAYGYPWFGRWGYGFCCGSFGVEEQDYHRAISFLTSMSLDDVIAEFTERKTNQDLCSLVKYYRNRSDTHLSTLQELLRFMITIKSRGITRVEAPPLVIPSLKIRIKRSCPQAMQHPKDKEKSLTCRKHTSSIADLKSRWPSRRMDYAAKVIVDTLKEKRESDPHHRGMTRQEVRDAVRIHIGDTGLLDFMLKSMSNVAVGGYRVRRTMNPATRILEYTIEDSIDGGRRGGFAKHDLEVIEPQISKSVVPSFSRFCPGFDVHADIMWLYKNVLLGFPETESAGLATRVIINSKYFVKEWPMKDKEDMLLRFMCKVVSASVELNLDTNRKSGPGELVAVPLYTSIGELKNFAGEALRDCYCFTERFQVTDIVGLEGLGDDELIFGVLESSSDIWVRGIVQDLMPELRYESGPDNWVVGCVCGAKDDDGERMVSCDVCEIWQHTRCIGIKDSEAVPALYLCPKCCSSPEPERVEPSFEVMDSYIDSYLMPIEDDFGMHLLQYQEDYGFWYGAPN